ncbi:MAG: DUF4271 domain-containing protein [Prevotella sp.]
MQNDSIIIPVADSIAGVPATLKPAPADSDTQPLPLYYQQTFLSADTMLHAELSGRSLGVEGNAIPYRLRSDNGITLLMLICFVLTTVAVKVSSGFIAKQIREFFYVAHSGPKYVNETANEVRFQALLVLQGALLLALFQYVYATHLYGEILVYPYQYLLMGISFAMMVGYLFFKYLLVVIVNGVFFERVPTGQWLKIQLFVMALGGVLVAPPVLLQVFFDLSVRKAGICLLCILLVVKLLLFYKCFTIFFKRLGNFLQFFLYFCALEVVPLALLWGGLLLMSRFLIHNY